MSEQRCNRNFRVKTSCSYLKHAPVLPEVAISRQVGYFRDQLGVKKSLQVGYFVAIFENELFLSFLGSFFDFLLKISIFVRKSALQLISVNKNLTEKMAMFDQILRKSGYFLPKLPWREIWLFLAN